MKKNIEKILIGVIIGVIVWYLTQFSFNKDKKENVKKEINKINIERSSIENSKISINSK